MYVVFAGSSPMGAIWDAPANAFQASADANALGLAGTQHGVTQGNVQTIAYDTQSNQLVTILGRTNGVFYLGDRYDNTLTGAAAGTSTSANFQAYRMIMLTVTFPTSTTMSIVLSSSWDFDTAMP